MKAAQTHFIRALVVVLGCRAAGLHLNQRAAGKTSGGLVSFAGVAVLEEVQKQASGRVVLTFSSVSQTHKHRVTPQNNQRGLFEKWKFYWILVEIHSKLAPPQSGPSDPP